MDVLLISSNSTKWQQPESKFMSFWDISGNKAIKATSVCQWIASQWWFPWFNDSNDIEIKDLPHPRKNAVCDIESTCRTLQESSSINTRRLSEELGLSLLLENLQEVTLKMPICFSWINVITSSSWVDICHQLLSNPMDGKFIKRILI